ncbi:MAG: hypothetical protein GXZ04_00020 [Clostridiales bacterium]|nr:hypothetical protein [Clostridiales bacterium]
MGQGDKKERAQITSTDIAEGTAKYIENLSTLLGENLTEEAKKARASQSIMREELFTSADMESYELGYVAGLLLDEVKPGWKQGFYETRLTLVDLLLMDVQPKDDQMNPDTERLVREEVEQVNREAGEQLSDILRAREDKRVPYLRVDIGTVASSYEANGNYLVGEDDITTGYGSQYRAGEGSITIRKSSVILNFTEAGDAFLYLPLTMAHEVKDSVMMIDSENVQIKNVRVGTETMDGRTVYTVTAKDM